MQRRSGVVPKARSLVIASVDWNGSQDHYRKLSLLTDRGAILGRYYESAGAAAGVIWVGGVGGGFDSPAGNLYHDLALTLPEQGINSLRLRYREPNNLEESVLDVMAGVALLESLGVSRVGLVGHSMGGAVVIQAADMCDSVRTVVALSSQTYGADVVDQIAPRSLLLIHGEADETLPPYCSASLYAKALEPKKLLLLPQVRHGLGEARDRVLAEVKDWLLRWLGPEDQG